MNISLYLEQGGDDMPDEPRNIVSIDLNMQYDLQEDTLRIHRPYLHCVQVVLNKDSNEAPYPQARTAFIGGYVMELDLRPEGEKAILRGVEGEKEISVLPSKVEANRTLVGRSRQNLQIGEILSDSLVGKEALRAFLRSPKEKDTIITQYLEMNLRAILEQLHLIPPEPDFLEEMKMLQQRDDFEYGKDYTSLYDNKVHAFREEVEKMVEKQNKEKTANEVKEASNAFSALMEKAHEEGKAVWQMSSEERSGLRAPVLVYKDKEGNDKTFSPPVANMLPAVQHQLEIGSKDPRWIPAKEAAANPDIAIRKGAKAVTFILFTKDKQPYTKKFFNMADVSGKGVPALTPAPELRRDVYLHDMIDYLARRAERGTFKDGNYFMMFMDAKEAANKSFHAKKEVYDFSNLDYETYMKARMEAQRRLDVILKADVQAPVPEKDYEKAFIQLLAKEIRQPSTTNYVIRAARKALNELKWQENVVKVAMKAFVPQAAFDNLARNGKQPSSVLMAITLKGIEPQKNQEQAAAR